MEGRVDSGGVSIVYKDGASLDIFQNTTDVFDFSGITQRDVIGKLRYKSLNIFDLKKCAKSSDTELYVSYYNKTGYNPPGVISAGFATPPAAAISLDLESLGACVEFDPATGDYTLNGAGFQMNNPSFLMNGNGKKKWFKLDYS